LQENEADRLPRTYPRAATMSELRVWPAFGLFGHLMAKIEAHQLLADDRRMRWVLPASSPLGPIGANQMELPADLPR